MKEDILMIIHIDTKVSMQRSFYYFNNSPLFIYKKLHLAKISNYKN